jgi:hypothetical protein
MPAQSAAPPGCNDAIHREFDFWVGNWRVTDAKGAFQGTNRVTKEYGDCVLMEHWQGAGGGAGSSFNTYLPGRGQWHQTWVDNGGGTLLLFGGMRSGSMVLQGERAIRGRPTIDRITWTPLPDGRVRQHWQASTNGGKTWSDVFDGYYKKAGS